MQINDLSNENEAKNLNCFLTSFKVMLSLDCSVFETVLGLLLFIEGEYPYATEANLFTTLNEGYQEKIYSFSRYTCLIVIF